MPATAWTDAQLDSMRGIGDTIADAGLHHGCLFQVRPHGGIGIEGRGDL